MGHKQPAAGVLGAYQQTVELLSLFTAEAFVITRKGSIAKRTVCAETSSSQIFLSIYFSYFGIIFEASVSFLAVHDMFECRQRRQKGQMIKIDKFLNANQSVRARTTGDFGHMHIILEFESTAVKKTGSALASQELGGSKNTLQVGNCWSS